VKDQSSGVHGVNHLSAFSCAYFSTRSQVIYYLSIRCYYKITLTVTTAISVLSGVQALFRVVSVNVHTWLDINTSRELWLTLLILTFSLSIPDCALVDADRNFRPHFSPCPRQNVDK